MHAYPPPTHPPTLRTWPRRALLLQRVLLDDILDSSGFAAGCRPSTIDMHAGACVLLLPEGACCGARASACACADAAAGAHVHATAPLRQQLLALLLLAARAAPFAEAKRVAASVVQPPWLCRIDSLWYVPGAGKSRQGSPPPKQQTPTQQQQQSGRKKVKASVMLDEEDGVAAWERQQLAQGRVPVHHFQLQVWCARARQAPGSMHASMHASSSICCCNLTTQRLHRHTQHALMRFCCKQARHQHSSRQHLASIMGCNTKRHHPGR